MIYYYELDNGSGRINAENDVEAVASLTQRYPDLLCIYKESDTEDGTPFIIVYEIAHTIATAEIRRLSEIAQKGNMAILTAQQAPSSLTQAEPKPHSNHS